MTQMKRISEERSDWQRWIEQIDLDNLEEIKRQEEVKTVNLNPELNS